MKYEHKRCCRVLQQVRGMSRRQAERFAAELNEHEVHAIEDLDETPDRGYALRQILDAIADRKMAEEAKETEDHGGAALLSAGETVDDAGGAADD